MPGKYSKKNKKRTHRRKKTIKKGKKSVKKLDFVDVPISDKVSLGSFETMGSFGGYHYQAYNNIFHFYRKILDENKELQKMLCFPNSKDEWMNTFIKINLNDDDLNSSELVIQNISQVAPEENLNKIIDAVKNCENKGIRFFIITVMLIVPGKAGSHANIVIIDLHEKSIELFEPHGKRGVLSTLDSLTGAYEISNRLLKKFFSKILPKYIYFSPQNYLPTYGLQAKIDALTGLCVSWSIIYVHYRILNPNKNRKQIIKYFDKKITKKFLLRYVKYVEEKIKSK